MNVLWLFIAILAIVTIVGVSLTAFLFPVGKDHRRHWRYGEYFRNNSNEFIKKD